MTPLSKENISTPLHEVGTGPTVLVVHGGPGLHHDYLVEPLSRALPSCHLVFYDQHSGSQATVNDLTAQLLTVLKLLSKNQAIHVIAHSWGAYLVLDLLTRHFLPIKTLLLISPVGLTRKRFDSSGARLMDRIPEELLKKVEELMNQNQGSELMNLVAPFYLADPSAVAKPYFTYYSVADYDSVIASLPAYDLRGIGPRLPKTHIIYGDADIELPEDTREIQEKATLHTISNAGHFSFIENPGDFDITARECLT